MKIRTIYTLILNWYSSDCLLNECEAIELCRLSVLLWPWSGTNQRLQLTFMKALTHLSEDSLAGIFHGLNEKKKPHIKHIFFLLVCKVFTTYRSPGSGSHSVLRLCTEYAMAETGRAKHPNADLSVLELSLRIVSNCCACIEGRLQLAKFNILDTLNRLHPSVTKQQKPWLTITAMWLRFYEIFTRYPDPCPGIRYFYYKYLKLNLI